MIKKIAMSGCVALFGLFLAACSGDNSEASRKQDTNLSQTDKREIKDSENSPHSPKASENRGLKEGVYPVDAKATITTPDKYAEVNPINVFTQFYLLRSDLQPELRALRAFYESEYDGAGPLLKEILKKASDADNSGLEFDKRDAARFVEQNLHTALNEYESSKLVYFDSETSRPDLAVRAYDFDEQMFPLSAKYFSGLNEEDTVKQYLHYGAVGAFAFINFPKGIKVPESEARALEVKMKENYTYLRVYGAVDSVHEKEVKNRRTVGGTYFERQLVYGFHFAELRDKETDEVYYTFK